MFSNRTLQPDTSPYEYISFNRDWEYTWISDMTARRLQRSRESVLGQRLHDLYPDSTVYIRAFEHVMQSREPLSFEAEASGWNTRLSLKVFPTADGIEVFFEELNDHWRAREDAIHLLELTRALNSAVRLDDVVEQIFAFLRRSVQGAELALLDPVRQVLEVQHRTDPDVQGHRDDRFGQVDPAGPVATTFRTGELLILGRAELLACAPTLAARLTPDIREVVTVALQSGGEMLGVLLLHLSEAGLFDILARSQVTVIAAQCAAAIARTRQFEEVQHSEARFRTLLESTHAVILELDPEFRVQKPVQSWEEFTGQRFETYREFGYLDAVHPDDRRHAQGTFARAAANRQPFELRGRLRGWQGDDRNTVVRCVPILNTRGEVTAWIGTVEDVTAQTRQRRWDQLTREVLAKLNSAATSTAMYRTALHEVVGLVGAQYAALIGPARPQAPLELLSAYGILDHQHVQVREVLERMQRHPPLSGSRSAPYWQLLPTYPEFTDLQSGEVLIVPFVDGEAFVAQMAIAFSPSSPPSETSLAFLEAMQPQLTPILRRAHLLRALELSETQSRTILASLDEGIFLLNAQQQVVATNPAFRKMFSLSTDLPPGGNFRPLLKQVRDASGMPVMPENYPAAQAFRDHRTVRNEVLHLTLHSGLQLWVSMNAYPLQRPDGQWDVVVSVADVTEPVELRQQLERQAFHDDLTGLANRRVFSQTLAEVQQEDASREASLLLLDIDRFKLINDTYGHATGDDVLKVVANRLKSVLPPSAVLTRLGGDEYCVILQDQGDAETAQVAGQIVEATRQPARARDVTVQISTSVGVAMKGRQGTSSPDLYRHADLALNHAKRLGAGQYAFYTEALSVAQHRTQLIERQMRHALLHHGFQLHYQPIVDLGNGHFCGFEALCRWHDEQLGWISPAEFIPIAEASGLIHPLGLHLLELALDQCRRWTQEWQCLVQMNVNISATQFVRPDFQEALFGMLARSGVRPEQLTLEVTEAVVIHDLADMVRQLTALRRFGVRVALDDFGTGFSSLAVLEQLPVDILKVDRALVAGVHLTPRRLELLRAVLLIAERLGLTVVAEGVEHPEEIQALRAMRCQRVQGFLISRALPPAEVTQERLQAWHELAHRTGKPDV